MTVRALNSITMKEIQELLRDRSRLLEVDLSGLDHDTAGMGADRAGAHSAPGHMAELASDASEKSVMYGQMEIQSDELVEVRDALERLENGSFGLCDSCNEDIPLERLRAIPYARLCMSCKTEEEKG